MFRYKKVKAEKVSSDLVFHCPGCNQKFEAENGMEGEKVECSCGLTVSVPKPREPEDEKACEFCGARVKLGVYKCRSCGAAWEREPKQPVMELSSEEASGMFVTGTVILFGAVIGHFVFPFSSLIQFVMSIAMVLGLFMVVVGFFKS